MEKDNAANAGKRLVTELRNPSLLLARGYDPAAWERVSDVERDVMLRAARVICRRLLPLAESAAGYTDAMEIVMGTAGLFNPTEL